MECVRTRNDAETMKAGELFAHTLVPGDVVALDGDLGAGKTVFVKGIAKGLGIMDVIVSPTFTILREYEGAPPLYHFDVYRIGSPDELFDIGFSEYLDGDGVCVIEWAGKAAELLPKRTVRVQIEKTGNNTREIIIKKDYEAK
jgi:tRNA threonylcarbamoyladenosine biosynthesis protein TsaE